MRVFILGAGVSKSYGGPLTDELLPDAMSHVRTKRGYVRLVKRIDKVLTYAFPSYNPTQGIYPNIEEVLSLLETWEEFNASIQEKPKYADFEIKEVRRWILRIVTERLVPLSGKITKDSAISKFAACLRQGDVIISFNWDLGLEKALDLLGKLDWEYFWTPKARDAVSLLKVHGSIDWFRTEDLYQVPKREQEPLAPTVGRISVLRWWDYTKVIPRGPKEITPHIIPPTHIKSFQDEEIRIIWGDVNKVLAQAERIYIFGYSLPPVDLQARITLRSGIELNDYQKSAGRDGIVVVANPDPDVKSSFDRLGFRFRFEPSKFEALNFSELLK